MKDIQTYQAMETEGILLNANESFVNIPLDARQEIAKEILDLPFHRYPEDGSIPLLAAYGNYIGKRPSQIMAGNGSDEMLGLLIGLHMKEGKKLYTFSPDFSMYDYYCGMHNGTMVKYTIQPNEPLDVDNFIATGKQIQADMILFSNPNNPTGNVVAQADLLKIVECFPKIPVVIDEAYADFDETTMLDYVDAYPNLLVTRTLSKAFSLAGCRLGFLIAGEETMKEILPYKVPYNVNRLSELAGCVILKHTDAIQANIRLIKSERERMLNAILSYHKEQFTIYPSHANFLYGKCSIKDKFLEACKGNNITIRNYEDDSFRITIGSPSDNDKLLSIIETL